MGEWSDKEILASTLSLLAAAGEGVRVKLAPNSEEEAAAALLSSPPPAGGGGGRRRETAVLCLLSIAENGLSAGEKSCGEATTLSATGEDVST